MLKFKIISRTCLIFMIAFVVSKRPILMFVMVAPTLKKKRLNQNVIVEFSR